MRTTNFGIFSGITEETESVPTIRIDNEPQASGSAGPFVINQQTSLPHISEPAGALLIHKEPGSSLNISPTESYYAVSKVLSKSSSNYSIKSASELTPLLFVSYKRKERCINFEGSIVIDHARKPINQIEKKKLYVLLWKSPLQPEELGSPNTPTTPNTPYWVSVFGVAMTPGNSPSTAWPSSGFTSVIESSDGNILSDCIEEKYDSDSDWTSPFVSDIEESGNNLEDKTDSDYSNKATGSGSMGSDESVPDLLEVAESTDLLEAAESITNYEPDTESSTTTESKVDSEKIEVNINIYINRTETKYSDIDWTKACDLIDEEPIKSVYYNKPGNSSCCCKKNEKSYVNRTEKLTSLSKIKSVTIADIQQTYNNEVIPTIIVSPYTSEEVLESSNAQFSGIAESTSADTISSLDSNWAPTSMGSYPKISDDTVTDPSIVVSPSSYSSYSVSILSQKQQHLEPNVVVMEEDQVISEESRNVAVELDGATPITQVYYVESRADLNDRTKWKLLCCADTNSDPGRIKKFFEQFSLKACCKCCPCCLNCAECLKPAVKSMVGNITVSTFYFKKNLINKKIQ